VRRLHLITKQYRGVRLELHRRFLVRNVTASNVGYQFRLALSPLFHVLGGKPQLAQFGTLRTLELGSLSPLSHRPVLVAQSSLWLILKNPSSMENLQLEWVMAWTKLDANLSVAMMRQRNSMIFIYLCNQITSTDATASTTANTPPYASSLASSVDNRFANDAVSRTAASKASRVANVPA
jgi:hypothetical protein